jgi:hypothetical protein
MALAQIIFFWNAENFKNYFTKKNVKENEDLAKTFLFEVEFLKLIN